MAEDRVERRLAAILAADVAGYSRLIGADEEGTLARLRAIRRELLDPKIAEHKGRIVKTTGDGVLVEFASVVDALRCAVEIQQALHERQAGAAPDRRIGLRIGIHQGDIVVEDGDIFGDGVNVAARLEALAEPGGICVSARVQEDAAGRLTLTFEDLGEQDLKNIARPIRVYRVGPVSGPRPSRPYVGEMPAIQSAAAALPLPDKPSVAVLPFANMSSDPEQEFLADGIAEDVITALSRYPSLFVISRNSCLAYKGRALEVRQIGRELGVRYVLEGSLRKAGDRIRVTAQLVEAESGNHVWADRYDRDLADIFAVQDEIAKAVTIAIAPVIAAAELHRAMRKPPGSLDAWAAYQRGLWHLGKATVDDNALAEKFFQQAVEFDPNFADGYCGLADAQIRAAGIFRTRALADAQRSAEPLARLAVALDAKNAVAHSTLSNALRLCGDLQGALAAAERALALSPNLASAYWRKGAALVFVGRPAEGIEDLRTSLRLEPHGFDLAVRLCQLAIGCYLCRAYEDAVTAADHGVRAFPDFAPNYRWLAAALGQLGRTEDAKRALDKAVAMAPASFELYVHERVPWYQPEDQAHMLDGLRKAGWEG